MIDGDGGNRIAGNNDQLDVMLLKEASALECVVADSLIGSITIRHAGRISQIDKSFMGETSGKVFQDG